MNVGDLFFGVHIDDSGFVPAVQKSATAAGDAGGAAFSSRFQRGFAGIGAGLKQSITTGLGIGAGLGVFNLVDKALSTVVSYMGDAVKAASDLNETVNKSAVVFGPASAEIETFGKTAATQMGLSENAAIGAAATFGNLFKSLGTAPEKVAPMSEALVKLASDLASFNNIPVDEALAKLQSGIVGQERPLRELGVAISAASVDVQAAAMGFHKLNGTFTEGEKVQARYALIFQQTGTAQGDFARTSDQLANSQRIVNAEWSDLQAKIGQGLMQLFTDLMPAIKGVVGLVGTLVSSIGDLGTAFDGLHRLVDPNYKAMQDFEAATRAAATAAGQDADAVWAFVQAQQAKAEADRQAAIEADKNVAGSKADLKVRQDQAKAVIEQQAAQYGLNAEWIRSQEIAQGLIDDTSTQTTLTEDQMTAQQKAAKVLDEYNRAMAAKSFATMQDTITQGANNAVAAKSLAAMEAATGLSKSSLTWWIRLSSASESTSTKVLSASNAMATAVLEGNNKIRAANKALEESYLSLGTNFKDTLKQIAQDAKTGLANIRFTMHHDGSETKKILEKDMAEAVKLRNQALKTGNTRALAEIDAYIADVQAKMDNLNMTQTIKIVTTGSLGGGNHVPGAGRAGGGLIPPGWSGLVGELGSEILTMLPGGRAYVTPHNEMSRFSMNTHATSSPDLGGHGTVHHDGTIHLDLTPQAARALHDAGYSGSQVGNLLRHLNRESLLPVEA